jgi:hypothetical protein
MADTGTLLATLKRHVGDDGVRFGTSVEMIAEIKDLRSRVASLEERNRLLQGFMETMGYEKLDGEHGCIFRERDQSPKGMRPTIWRETMAEHVACDRINAAASRSMAEMLERIVALEKALRPLAEAAYGYEEHAPDDQGCAGLTLRDARRARCLLDGLEHNEMPESSRSEKMSEPYVTLSMAHQMCLDAMKPLQERIAAESQNAKRYRWLRERDLDAIDACGVFAGRPPQNVVLTGEDLDRAIDAAMDLDGREHNEMPGGNNG